MRNKIESDKKRKREKNDERKGGRNSEKVLKARSIQTITMSYKNNVNFEFKKKKKANYISSLFYGFCFLDTSRLLLGSKD